MSVPIALLAAASLVLIASGLPPLRPLRLSPRVEPYLSGLHGTASPLLAKPQPRGRLAGLLERLGRWLPSSGSGLERRLEEAGESLDGAGFRLEQLQWGAAAVAGVWLCVLLAAAAGAGIDVRVVPALSSLAFSVGWLARDWWLGRRARRRRAELQDELPTAIDLLTLAIVSGESVPAGFARVASLLGYGIGAEFGKVVGDIRAGAPAAEALEDMKQRVPVPAIERFVDALVTGIDRGAPLAQVLRAQAEDGRELRRRMLLEMGGRREVMMLVPVVFLIMPVVVLFTLLPGLVALDLLVP